MTPPSHDPKTDHPVAVAELRCQLPTGVMAAGREPIRLSWKVAPAVPRLVQEAYEIEASVSADFAGTGVTSGVVESADQVAVRAPGSDLASREARHYRVRIRTARGWTAWGPSLRVEAGLLDADDWEARPITLPDDPGRDRQAPSPVLRHEFDIAADVASARLYVSALGLYRLRINGQDVGDSPLAPGWTAYRHRLVADTYDVTALLRAGTNVIVATLGDGWYRGRIGWSPGEDRCNYGEDVGLIAQLEAELGDGSTQHVVTDEAWRVTTGEVRSADLYDGSNIDLRKRLEGIDRPGRDVSDWQPAKVVPFDMEHIEPRMAEPVHVVQTFPVRTVPHKSGGLLRLDVGQNIAGYVRLRVQGRRDDVVTVRHAEVLEADGALHTRSLRSARATDSYVLADARVTDLEPAFTFHGFRHVEIETSAQVLVVEFVAISSDTPRRGWFHCSDARLSRFHENVVWSQRDNFVSIPSDCPQRDERLGWTGDAQAFAPTACILFEAGAFWSSWLIDLALDQHPELGVPTVVPDVVLASESRFGRAGWADAAAMVPWAVYEASGDIDVLRRQYDSMRSHVESLRARLGLDGLLPEAMQFGDWLDPDAPSDQPWDSKADSRFLANAFLAHSARLVARAAVLLDRPDDARTYQEVGAEMARRTWTEWNDHATETQTGCAVALCFGLVPEGEREAVAATLARNVRDVDGRVATGFLGTPLVLPALASAGYWDEAYLMLLRTEAPSWLYQVEQGATTVWERWDAIRPDGSIHDGRMRAVPKIDGSEGRESQMLSFNHYAYGAVIDWVYRNLAGLAPDVEAPGYRRVRLAPRPVVDIDWARASVETAYGTVSTSWRVEDDALQAEVELPFGTTGEFTPPSTSDSVTTVDGQTVEDGAVTLAPGRHAISVTAPAIAGTR